ncbi:MAG: Smr/MutS family protein [Verrucomicrobiaceae bacterium]|nr:Smr/MutS family protein [Verrucomicrobiaceae bacterium]
MMMECPQCEFPLDPAKTAVCPKCGGQTRGSVVRGLLEVDVAHNGETWDMAREKIVKAVDEALLHGHSGVKIIHGHGATTGRSTLAGLAVAMLRGYAQRYGGRLAPDRGNPGAHLLWLNR